MDCRQVQSVLALAVGQDLSDVTTLEAVREHVGRCPACQRLEQQFAVAHAALLDSRTVPRLRRGLWPQVAQCIADWDRRPQFARFNVWVPSLAAVAACVLLVTVAVLEVDQSGPQWLSGVRAEQSASASRNLFATDPRFAKSRGDFLSPQDVARWRQFQSPTQPVQSRPYRPTPTWVHRDE